MRDGPSGRVLGVSSEKQAYKLARNLLKEFAIECIAEETTRRPNGRPPLAHLTWHSGGCTAAFHGNPATRLCVEHCLD
jgi:hypothetical protein